MNISEPLLKEIIIEVEISTSALFLSRSGVAGHTYLFLLSFLQARGTCSCDLAMERCSNNA